MIRQIIRASIHNNRLEDVTGLLLFGRGWFLQVLEGGADQVASAFSRIRSDERHTGVRLIAETAAEARTFRDWNMVASCADTVDLGRLGLADLDLDRLDAEAAMAVLMAAGEAERERERRQALGVRAA
jgi:hypothetical protein